MTGVLSQYRLAARQQRNRILGGGKLNRVNRGWHAAMRLSPFHSSTTQRGHRRCAPHPVIEECRPTISTTTMPRFATLSPDGAQGGIRKPRAALLIISFTRKSARGRDSARPSDRRSGGLRFEAFPRLPAATGQALLYCALKRMRTLGRDRGGADCQWPEPPGPLTGPGAFRQNLGPSFRPMGRMEIRLKRKKSAQGGLPGSARFFGKTPASNVMPADGSVGAPRLVRPADGANSAMGRRQGPSCLGWAGPKRAKLALVLGDRTKMARPRRVP